MVTGETELELRARLAERTETEGNRQARRLCAVSSKACRAGDDHEWFELEVIGKRTYCFCAAHALAAEVAAAVGMPAEFIISTLHELERGH